MLRSYLRLLLCCSLLSSACVGMASDIVRYPSEDWVSASSKVRLAPHKEWLSSRVLAFDAWVKSDLERHNLSVGWMHDYVDPHTGRFLPWHPQSQAPVTSLHPKLYAAWLAHVRVHNIAQVLEAARLYRLTGEARFLHWAKAQMDAYALHYTTLTPQRWNGEARLFSQALDEAVYSFPLIEAVRLVRGSVTPNDVERWRTGLFEPMMQSLGRSGKGVHNISVWLAAARFGIALEFDFVSERYASLLDAYGLKVLLAEGVSADGFWFEGTFHYQDYVVKALGEWLYAAGIRRDKLSSDEVVLFAEIGQTAQKLMFTPLKVRFADGELPMVHDTIGFRSAPNFRLWASLWRVLPTYVGLSDPSAKSGWDALLDEPPAVAPLVLPDVNSRVLEGLFSVQLFSNRWQALIRYGQGSKSHAHQDALGYDLQFDGVWLFRDQGTVGYGSNLHSQFFRRAQAHSVPLIDRDGQMPWPAIGKINAFDGELATAVISMRNYQPGVSVTRSFMAGPIFSDEISFQRNSSKLPMGVVFNTDCQAFPRSGMELVNSVAIGDKGGFRHWQQVQHFNLMPYAQFELSCGNRSFLIMVSGADLKQAFLGRTPSSLRNGSRQGIYVETSPVHTTKIKFQLQPL